jgi:hypothetical protein
MIQQAFPLFLGFQEHESASPGPAGPRRSTTIISVTIISPHLVIRKLKVKALRSSWRKDFLALWQISCAIS